MKNAIAPVKNIKRLAELGETLAGQTGQLPGIAVAHGDSGIGKSTGLTWLSTTKLNACYVRAMQVWSPSSMLYAIARELDVEPTRSLSATIELIVGELSRTNRPLIVDEADYVVDQARLLNTLRDLHDLSTMPLILVGMADFVRKLRTRTDQRQFAGRVALDLEFKPLDLADVEILAKTLAEVEISEDLLALLHEKSQGITRLVCVGLARIETFAKHGGIRKIGRTQWGDRALNLVTADVKPRRAA